MNGRTDTERLEWRQMFIDLVEQIEISKSRPKPGPCGMSIEACARHSIYLVDGCVVMDARAAIDAAMDAEERG